MIEFSQFNFPLFIDIFKILISFCACLFQIWLVLYLNRNWQETLPTGITRFISALFFSEIIMMLFALLLSKLFFEGVIPKTSILIILLYTFGESLFEFIETAVKVVSDYTQSLK